MGKWKPNEHIEIIFDESKQHRLKFSCKWDDNLPKCLYIMLNPSTADLEQSDPTIDKCIKIAKHNNYGSITIVNLFSLRTPKPEELLDAEIRTIPKNLEIIKEAIDETDRIVAAWGEKGTWFNANYPILKYMQDSGKKLYYLESNRYGWPKHPLFLKLDSVMKEYFYKDNLDVLI